MNLKEFIFSESMKAAEGFEGDSSRDITKKLVEFQDESFKRTLSELGYLAPEQAVELTAQVGELAALIRMQQGWLLIDPDYRGSPLEAKANELLTRIGEDNE